MFRFEKYLDGRCKRVNRNCKAKKAFALGKALEIGLKRPIFLVKNIPIQLALP